nr:hypothetical protein [Tanacetum cinerariifolium]
MKRIVDYAAGGRLRKISAEKSWTTIRELARYEDEWWNDLVILGKESLNYKNPDHKQLLGIMKYKVRTLMEEAITLMEERIKQLKEYMSVIGSDFMQLSLEVVEKLKEEIRIKKNKFTKIKKITRASTLPNYSSLDVNLGDKRGTDPPIKPHSLDSFRMEEVDSITIHTPPSPHVVPFHPKDMYCYHHPYLGDPKKHYGFKPSLLGQSGLLDVVFSNLEVLENNFLGGLSLLDKPKELKKEVVEKLKEEIRIKKNKFTKIKKITRYPDIKDLNPLNGDKFSEALTEKACFHTPKFVSPKSLCVKHVRTIFPNPPLGLIDAIIEYLDLEPKSVERASVLHPPDGVGSQRHQIVPYEELNGVLIDLVAREDTFSGNKKEDAYDHVDQVLNIVSLFNIPVVSHDAVLLRVFLFNVIGSGKRWVDRLTSGAVNTWEPLKKAFIQRYYPLSKTVKLLEDIHNFKQKRDESLYQAWERYNDLLYKCPTHDINNHQKDSVNVMPKGIFELLKPTNLRKMNMLIEVADMTKKAPLWVVENILVRIDKLLFPSNFVIINRTSNETVILGRPFLATIHAKIHVFNREISLGVGHIDVNESVKKALLKSWVIGCFEETLDPDKDPMKRSFDDYKWVFDLEIEQLAYEYELGIEKKGHILDMIWENCKNISRKAKEWWHDYWSEEEE